MIEPNRLLARAHLRVVSSQPPEVLLAHRVSDVQAAWATLFAFPYLPQSFFAWIAARDRLEAERVRVLREWRS